MYQARNQKFRPEKTITSPNKDKEILSYLESLTEMPHYNGPIPKFNLGSKVFYILNYSVFNGIVKGINIIIDKEGSEFSEYRSINYRIGSFDGLSIDSSNNISEINVFENQYEAQKELARRLISSIDDPEILNKIGTEALEKSIKK